MKMRNLTMIICIALFFCVSMMMVSAADYYVATTGSNTTGNGSQGNPWQTIQYAINNVSSEDTINVAVGTYNETLNIENRSDITIVGADKNTTIIKSSTSLGWGNPLGGSYGATRQTMVRVVNSTDIDFSNFTFDFDLMKTAVSGINYVSGIWYWSSTGTIDNNILKNISILDDETTVSFQEHTIYVRAMTQGGYNHTTRANVAITNNEFINTGRTGVNTHDYVNITIDDNLFHKDAPYNGSGGDYDLGYAIEVGSESIGTVTDNTIYGYEEGEDWTSAGIYIENAFTDSVPISFTKTVSIERNEVYNSEIGAHIGSASTNQEVAIVVNFANNNIHDNRLDGVIVTDNEASYGSSVTINAQNNTITNNGNRGYYIYTKGDGDVTFNATNETITGHDYGMYIDDTAPDTSVYAMNIINSILTNNTGYGVYNNITTQIDATLNYWGDFSGPGGVADGLGDNVSANVTYSPWLGATYGTSPMTWYVDNSTNGSIQAAIDAASAGDTINVVAGIYTITSKILVNKEGITITGDVNNPENVVVQYNPAANSLIFDMRASNVIIEGVKTVSGKDGFFFDQGVTGCTISHCIIEDTYQSGIYIYNGNGHTVEYTTITNPGQMNDLSYSNGIYTRADSTTIDYCIITSDKEKHMKWGIDLEAGSNHVITENTIAGSWQAAIRVVSGVKPVTITNNDIDDATEGYAEEGAISLDGNNDGSTISGNHIDNVVSSSAIVVWPAWDITIANNQIGVDDSSNDIRLEGIRVSGCGGSEGNRVEITGNTIHNTGYAAVLLINSGNAYVYNNTITKCNNYGADNTGDWDYASIHVDEDSDDVIVDNNIISDGINGIQTWSNNTNITNNEIYNMGLSYADTKGTGDGIYYNSGVIVGTNWLTGNFKLTGTQISGNSIYNNYHGLYVRDYATLSLEDSSVLSVTAESNYWGDFSGPGGVADGLGDNVSANVDYYPYYRDSVMTHLSGNEQTTINETIEVTQNSTDIDVIENNTASNITIPRGIEDVDLDLSKIIDTSATTVNATLTGSINIEANTSVGLVTVQIPENITISGNTSWTGIINTPTVKEISSVTVTADSGYSATVSKVIEIGFDDVELVFDKAVRIVIEGQAGKNAGYSRGGVFTKISAVCSADTQTAGDALAAGADCKIDSGNDLVIWTKHFTAFITYSQTALSPSSPSTNSRGGMYL